MSRLMDYRDYYNLEGYLFGTVTQRFARQGFLNAFDLFSIVIWKAERSKSYFARRLIGQSGTENLEQAARQLTEGIAHERGPKERLLYLLGSSWGFRLPTASSILAVLYPEEFTIYDERVCDQLRDFHDLNKPGKFNWEGYQEFIRAVKQATPNGLPLRDKDRYLWGKSFHDQLKWDIARRYQTSTPGGRGVARARP